jgi:hypothetical protein
MTITPIITAQPGQPAVYPLRLILQVPERTYSRDELHAMQQAFLADLITANIGVITTHHATRMLDRLVRPKFDVAMCRAYKDLLVEHGHEIGDIGKPMGPRLSVITHERYRVRTSTLLWTSAHSMDHKRQDIPVATVKYDMSWKPIRRIDRMVVESAQLDGNSVLDNYATHLRTQLLNIRLVTWAKAFLDNFSDILHSNQRQHYYCFPDDLSIAVQPGEDKLKDFIEVIRNAILLRMHIPSRWVGATVMVNAAMVSPAVVARTNLSHLHDMVNAADDAKAIAMLLQSSTYQQLLKQHEMVNGMIREAGEAVAAAVVAQREFSKLQNAIQEQSDAHKLARVFFDDPSSEFESPF